MTLTLTARYNSFCQRMWLDYCDENNTILSEHLTYEEYTTRYKTYLYEKFYLKERFNESGPTSTGSL